ncbi:MAG: M81 family metallopeptidase [Alphaproteobacteria bacterium]|nr:M81 family metallopeptidase [Alphaproteobacteria bacterium]
MSKRVFIAALGTETNQFVPFPTDLAAFAEYGIWRGDATRHPPTSFTGPLHVWRREAEARGWTVIEGLATFASPSGTTVRAVYEGFREEILAGIRAAMPLDAVLLNVHGAMVADGYDDCEGDLLSHVRAIVGPTVAVGAEFDLHCHLTQLMLDSADVLVGYKEYPHTDPMERAAELFAIVADTVMGKVRPVMVRHDCRMIAQYRTSVPPIDEFVRRMKSFEGRDGILSVSLSHGFAFADVEDVGTRTLVVADGDRTKAEALARQLGRELWDNRERYATRYLTVEQAMEAAGRHNQGTLVLADRADNPGSGAPGDSTFLLQALIQRRLGPTLFGVMWDPQALKVAQAAGEGATLTMRLGGKAGAVSGMPVDLEVTVHRLARDVRQPYGPVMAPLGDMALLKSEHVDIAINGLRTQTFHADAFRAVGAEPTDYRTVVVKSAQHFYNGFAGLAREVLYVASPGAADPDVTRLPYRKRRTPFWPKVADPWA